MKFDRIVEIDKKNTPSFLFNFTYNTITVYFFIKSELNLIKIMKLENRAKGKKNPFSLIRSADSRNYLTYKYITL